MGEAKRKRLARDGEEPLTLERVQIGCELGLLFMIWHLPRNSKEDDGVWYRICTDTALRYPWGSYRYTWWWAMRDLGDPDEEGETWEKRLENFRLDFAWKLEQYETVLKSQRESVL